MPHLSGLKRLFNPKKRRQEYPLEPKLLNGNYYLYVVTSRYARSIKRARKVSGYIRITADGAIESHRTIRTVYEYGNSQLIYALPQDLILLLRKHFPDRWESIYAVSVTKFSD